LVFQPLNVFPLYVKLPCPERVTLEPEFAVCADGAFPLPPLALYVTVYVVTAVVPHCAYRVIFPVTVSDAPAAYAVPAPLELVFQPLNVFPLYVKLPCPATVTLEPALTVCADGAFPLPPLALYVTVYVSGSLDPSSHPMNADNAALRIAAKSAFFINALFFI
jgi:hypothetical protein